MLVTGGARPRRRKDDDGGGSGRGRGEVSRRGGKVGGDGQELNTGDKM